MTIYRGARCLERKVTLCQQRVHVCCRVQTVESLMQRRASRGDFAWGEGRTAPRAHSPDPGGQATPCCLSVHTCSWCVCVASIRRPRKVQGVGALPHAHFQKSLSRKGCRRAGQKTSLSEQGGKQGRGHRMTQSKKVKGTEICKWKKREGNLH